MFNDDELRAFEAVADTGSFSRAAERLGQAQSSVSQRLARLEARFGRTLIERTTRRVGLTPAGRTMLHYVRAILSLAEDARRRLSVPPVDGKVRLGVAEEFALTDLAAILGLFRQHHHRFEISFQTGRNDQLFRALDEGRVDVILGKCASGRSRGELLWRETLVWGGASDGLKIDNGVLPLVAYLPPSETREAAETVLRAERRPWTVIAESENLLGLLAAAQAGLGVLPIGRRFLPGGLADVSSRLELPPPGTIDYVIDHRTTSDDCTSTMAAILREFAKQIVLSANRSANG